MLKRVWWFALGLLAGISWMAWLLKKAVKARPEFTPANLGRHAAISVADALEGAGTRLRSPNGQG